MEYNAESENKSILRRITDKLFGGIDMTWPKVIIFAVGTAVVTALFLLLPVFKNTSFERMGVYVDAWILFAIIIMSNCKKPLESALKTFVFFLVSQPLIYLLQVPFFDRGWAIFGYYKYWFMLTLLTFPAAFIGWYIRKKNWLSLIILTPVMIYLAAISFDSFKFAFAHFPYRIVAALFCLAQIVLYLIAFTSGKWQKIAGAAVPALAVILMALLAQPVDIHTTMFLPDDPVLTESAYIVTSDTDLAEITVSETGESSMISIYGKDHGTTCFTVKDGESEYRYSITLFEDDAGHTQIEITKR